MVAVTKQSAEPKAKKEDKQQILKTLTNNASFQGLQFLVGKNVNKLPGLCWDRSWVSIHKTSIAS
jgi:hypothetical protein